MSSALAAPKAIGESVEDRVLQAIDALEAADDRDDWRDAVAVDVIDGRADTQIELGSTPLLQAGTPVEIKGARMRVSAGDGERDGHWLFKINQHERLVAEAAAYLLVVYADEPAGPRLERLLIVPATIVDSLLAGRWYDVDRREEQLAQIRWSAVLDAGGGAGGE